MIFFDMNDASDNPAIAEPLFAGLNTKIQLLPAMNAEDLKKGDWTSLNRRITQQHNAINVGRLRQGVF
jgi:hypothetical protein